MHPNNGPSDFEALLREALGSPTASPLDPMFRQQLAFEAGCAEGKRTAWRWGSGGMVAGVLLGLFGGSGGWPNHTTGVPTPDAPSSQMAKISPQESLGAPKTSDSPDQENALAKDTFLARDLPWSKAPIWNPLTDPDQVSRTALSPGGTQFISTGTPRSPQNPPTNLRSISEVMEDLK